MFVWNGLWEINWQCHSLYSRKSNVLIISYSQRKLDTSKYEGKISIHKNLKKKLFVKRINELPSNSPWTNKIFKSVQTSVQISHDVINGSDNNGISLCDLKVRKLGEERMKEGRFKVSIDFNRNGDWRQNAIICHPTQLVSERCLSPLDQYQHHPEQIPKQSQWFPFRPSHFSHLLLEPTVTSKVQCCSFHEFICAHPYKLFEWSFCLLHFCLDKFLSSVSINISMK